jgi:hypothetical protein
VETASVAESSVVVVSSVVACWVDIITAARLLVLPLRLVATAVATKLNASRF